MPKAAKENLGGGVVESAPKGLGANEPKGEVEGDEEPAAPAPAAGADGVANAEKPDGLAGCPPGEGEGEAGLKADEKGDEGVLDCPKVEV